MTTSALYHIYLQHPVISTDSRNIPAGCIFFALKGENFDGNKFAKGALEQGASFAVIDDTSIKTDDRFILVEDVLGCLQALAHHHRQQLTIPFLAITGTNGKTTTKELLNAVLSQKFKTLATKGNFNNHIGVPLTLLSITNDIQLAIIEMGANHQGEIKELCEIALPDLGLISNVGKAHLEGFGGFEGVKKTKGEMYDFLKSTQGTIFINNGNEHLKSMLGTNYTKIVRYGAGPDSVVGAEITTNNPFIGISWHHKGTAHTVQTQLTGSYNLENILAAIAVGLHFGLNSEEINKGLSGYEPGNNRSQIVKTENNTLIGDYYNANPSSMAVAIENLTAISASKKVLIIGDMFELGETSDAEHEAILQKASAGAFDAAYYIGNSFSKWKEYYPGIFFTQTEEALAYLNVHPIKNSTILIKGSRGMRLEKLIPSL